MPFKPTYEVPAERRAYFIPAGRVGALMLHGFMGSPKSSRPMAEHLAAQGITMACPLLPGHGNLPNKIHRIPRQAWLDEAEEAYHHLRRTCDKIFLIGHSMGTVLGAYLALKHEVGGMVMLAPFFELPDPRIRIAAVLRYITPWFNTQRNHRLREIMRDRVHDFDPSIDLDDPARRDEVQKLTRMPLTGVDEMRKVGDWGRKQWRRLNVPALILQGEADDAVSPGNAQNIYARLPHPDKELIIFPGAGHELMRPFDPIHREVWAKIHAFIRARA